MENKQIITINYCGINGAPAVRYNGKMLECSSYRPVSEQNISDKFIPMTIWLRTNRDDQRIESYCNNPVCRYYNVFSSRNSMVLLE